MRRFLWSTTIKCACETRTKQTSNGGKIFYSQSGQYRANLTLNYNEHPTVFHPSGSVLISHEAIATVSPNLLPIPLPHTIATMLKYLINLINQSVERLWFLKQRKFLCVRNSKNQTFWWQQTVIFFYLCHPDHAIWIPVPVQRAVRVNGRPAHVSLSSQPSQFSDEMLVSWFSMRPLYIERNECRAADSVLDKRLCSIRFHNNWTPKISLSPIEIEVQNGI